MRSFVLGVALAVFGLVGAGQNQAQGSFCGVARCCHCHCCTPCCMQCCTVMRTCMVTEYTYQDTTAYKIVYEDVETPVNVPAVEYQPAPRIACVPDTVLVPPTPSACAPAPVPCATPAACPPAACATANQCIPVPAAPPMCSVNICRKVELPGMNPVDVQKPDVCKRVVQRQVPYTVTLCIPHQVCRQVPVQVCCPVPCCCISAPAAKCGGEGCAK